MPIQRFSPRGDGHDHLRRTDDVDTRDASTPTRTRASQPAPNTDEVLLSAEGMTSDDFEYDTQDIILLEPKAPMRQPSKRLPTSKQPSRQTSVGRQPTNSRADVRQSTSTRSAVRQPTNSRSAVRQPSDRLRTAQQPARQTEQPVRQTTQPRGAEKLRPQTEAPQRRYHWLVPTGIIMIITIACYLLLYGGVVGGRLVYNNLTYGSGTRTSQIDAVVGDHDSATSPTHFIALNLHGTIDIVEFPSGDVTHAKVYPGPHLLWSNADRAVVTLEVKDVNGDQKPDVVIHVWGDTDLLFHQTTANFVLLNKGSGFSAMSPLSS